MNNTIKFRSIFTLMVALFMVIGVNGQSGMTNSKKKSSKTEKKVSEKSENSTDKEEDEEIEYYYSYIVLELTLKNEMYSVTMDKSAFDGELKLPQGQMQMAKKAASGGLQYSSETEFLNFMANANYELVTVAIVPEQMGKKSRMYFRIKLER